MTAPTTKLIKSPLKWAGGKSALVPKIKAIWDSVYSQNPNLRYVDLFAGGCVIPLNLQATRCVINDVNPHLISFWHEIKTYGELDTTNFVSTQAFFSTIRELFNRHHSPHHFYYLNRTGFNGLYRCNQKGIFNVSWGKYITVAYERDFTKWQEIIKHWEIRSTDFRHINTHVDDLVFADPPYDDGFTQYHSSEFNWEDQLSLAKKLAAHPGISIATNKATPRILDLYNGLGFQIELIDMPRRISCNGDRKPVQEMFATRGL